MNNLIKFFANEFYKKKRTYLFLFGLIIAGIVFGSLFITVLDKQDKNLVGDQINAFFTGIKTNRLDYIGALVNSLISNVLAVISIWLLGISIIGIPIILFLIFFKGFILGFSIGSIIFKYKMLGLIYAFFYIFPHHILGLAIILIVSFYALHFSTNLFRAMFKKQTINFKNITSRYFRILIFSLVSIILVSLFEVFIMPNIMRLFTFFMK